MGNVRTQHAKKRKAATATRKKSPVPRKTKTVQVRVMTDTDTPRATIEVAICQHDDGKLYYNCPYRINDGVVTAEMNAKGLNDAARELLDPDKGWLDEAEKRLAPHVVCYSMKGHDRLRREVAAMIAEMVKPMVCFGGDCQVENCIPCRTFAKFERIAEGGA